MNPHLSIITEMEKIRPDLRDTVFTAHEFPNGRAIHIEFPTSYSMNMTMIRVQEFYESPHPTIQGRRFDLEDYMDIYAATEHKEWSGLGWLWLYGAWLRRRNPTVKGFDYLTRVLGTNFPGYVFSDFVGAHRVDDSLRTREVWLESQISVCLDCPDIYYLDPEEMAAKVPGYYVIGTYKGDRDAKGTLAHELAHARYFLDPEYNAAVTSLVVKNWSPRLEKALRKRGYDASTDIDEMHAFALTGWPEWFPWYMRDKQARKLRRLLKHLVS
jgi:hypothetical protein